MNHDEDLREFFGALRAQDDRQPPPAFNEIPERKPPVKRRIYRVLVGSAATLLLLFVWRQAVPEPTQNAAGEVLVISIDVTETTNTQTLLHAPDPIDSWESPSAWLIEDF